jgi:hypothetical protein
MRRLLWKEWRERWPWALAVVLATVGTSVFAHGQRCCGQAQPAFTPWLLLPAVVSLLFGMGAYASESVVARAHFVFARPLPWSRLLGAKLLFAGIILLGSPLLAGFVLRLTLPAAYAPFMTPAHLLAGVGDVALVLGAAYLLGLPCGLLLPGLAGGMLALVSLLTVVIAVMLVVPPGVHENEKLTRLFLLPSLGMGAILGGLFGGLPLARFGLTLDAGERIRRFLPAFLGTLVATGVLGVGVALPLWTRTAEPRLEWGGFAPGGRYLFAYVNSMPLPQWMTNGRLPWDDINNNAVILRVSDGKVLKRFRENTFGYWVTGDRFIASQVKGNLVLDLGAGSERTVRAHGSVFRRVSSDGNYAFTTREEWRTLDNRVPPTGTAPQRCTFYLEVYNLDTGREHEQQFMQFTVPAGMKHPALSHMWWQDAQTIGYCDFHEVPGTFGYSYSHLGSTHFIRLQGGLP